MTHLPTYSQWLAAQDWTPAYRRYRRNLQLIGLNDAGKRWVLKNPSHLHALDALMATFPDALAAGPLAYARALPLVLTDPGALSPQAAQTLVDLGIQQVVIAGGPTAVSPA